MNLHRTTGRPDWTGIPPSDHNSWQALAVTTRGIVTPGNLTTLLGLILVVAGLIAITLHSYWLAGSLIVTGRLLDLVDGWLADKTGTKSPLGELMDAGADKVETFAAIVVMYISALAPWWLLTALLVPHVVIGLIAALARVQGRELHPSRLGKLSMATLWVSLFGFIAIRLFEWGGVARAGIVLIAIATITLTAAATVDYVRQLRAK